MSIVPESASSLAAVLELGSLHLRAGSPHFFPAENEPFVITETSARVGQQKGPAENGVAAAGAPQADGPVAGLSSAAAADGGGGRLVHPIVRGVIKDWEVLEVLMDHVLYDRMGWRRGEEGGLLLAEPLFTSRDERERLCQLAFEAFNVPAFFVADQAVLALYSIGKLSGLVVDIGLDKIDIAPVVDGMLQPSAATRLPYGGRQLTHYLMQLIAQRPAAANGSNSSAGSGSGPMQLSYEAAEALKKAIFRVAESSSSSQGAGTMLADAPTAPGARGASPAVAAAAAARHTIHTLPDGQTITVGSEGAALGEALLCPARMGLDLPPLAAVAQAAVSALEDKGARKAVGEAVLVCGGGSGGGFASGLPPRLLREMRALAPASQALTLAAVPEYMPAQSLPNASWMGGAVLGRFVFQQGNVAQQALTKAHYDEYGPAVVHRKCS